MNNSQLKTKIYQYSVALLFASTLFLICSVYLYYRRGYYDLYIINKVLAGVSAFQLGVVLLLGPLSRAFDRFDNLLKFRNELGLIAFLPALAHPISSFFFLEKHFPQASYLKPISIPFVFGLISIIILSIIFIASNGISRAILTPKKWWMVQYWGIRLAFMAMFLHVLIMKYKGWVDWYLEGGSSRLKHPEWPGLGLLEGWFVILVLLVRVAEMVNPRLGKLMLVLFFPLLIGVYIFTFWWGKGLFS